MENKKSFVENELSMALKRADNNIDKVLYNYNEAKASETVFVIYKSGYKREINVIRHDYFGLMMWVSVGALVIIYAALSEFHKHNNRSSNRKGKY